MKKRYLNDIQIVAVHLQANKVFQTEPLAEIARRWGIHWQTANGIKRALTHKHLFEQFQDAAGHWHTRLTPHGETLREQALRQR